MPFSNLLLQISDSLENFKNILEYERETFESKFSYFKDQIINFERKLQQYQQDERDGQNWKTEETESEYESGSEDLQEALDDTKRKLEQEESKNKVLNQDVDDLNAMIKLYVREAKMRDDREEKWQEDVTVKYREKLSQMEREIIRNVGKIDNLENVIEELHSELYVKDETILDKDKEIKFLEKKLKEMESN